MSVARPAHTTATPSLLGASVIVTRPAGTTASFAKAIRFCHGNPVLLPGLALRAAQSEDVATVLRSAKAADLAIFTSPAAVKYAWRLLPSLRFAQRVCIAAVGAGTARALRARGVNEVVIPQGTQDSSGLLQESALRGVRGKFVAVIGAPGGRDLLVPTLKRRGAKVLRVDVYERTAPRWTRRHFAALEIAPKPWLLLISSAEAMAHLATALPPGLVLALRRAECVVSSARLAGLAIDHGFARVHVARSALAADLLAAAGAALSQHRL